MSVQSEVPLHEQLPWPIVPDWHLKANAGLDVPISNAENKAIT
jgi:hypothetical protein